MKKGVLLLSGGMDSTTLLGLLLKEGWGIHPVIFDYGQQHKTAENAAAKKIWDFYKKEYPDSLFPYKVITLDLAQIGNSALTDSNIDVPDNMKEQPKTVVPHRNGLMTTLAAAYGESLNVFDIFLTPVADDYESYPDCRPAAIKALQTFLTLSATNQPTDVNVHTPFVKTWKKEVINLGLQLKVPYELTHSCYKGLSPACGECPACRERLQAFKLNNAEDPIEYAKVPEVLV
jgi:7-cyano-7-deazaguanine synthase